MKKTIKRDYDIDVRFDFKNIKVGDYVFSDAERGPCSGGARYGNGSICSKITKKNIHLSDGSKYSRKTLQNREFPVYVLQYFYTPL